MTEMVSSGIYKEPTMSEFKVGDQVIYMHPAYTLVYLVQAVKGMEILVNEVWFDGYHFRHATALIPTLSGCVER